MPEIVQEIGAYAGLASVLGLALLSALYFSQARDVKRLREWAGRAPERVPGQPGPQQPQRVVAQPLRPGQPQGQQPASAAGAAGQPARPGQQGAPNQAAASGAAAAAAGQAAAAGAAKQGEAPAGGATPNGPVGGQAPPNGPASAQGGSGQTGAPTQIIPGRPSTPAANRPGDGAPVVPSGRTPAGSGTRLPNRPAPPSTTAPPVAQAAPWYRTPRYLVLAIVGVLVVGGGIVFGITQMGDSDSGGAAPAQQASGNGQSSGGDGGAAKRPPVNPANVTVAVLNGTTVQGLAAQVSDELQQQGFRVGNVDNSPDASQQRAESVVQFASGHRREAMAVGRRLKIGQREPIDPAVQQLAGDATVVVVTGEDQNTSP